ncbi:hypothetical protein [Roseixanthobacter liquoris]|uniref:hypothetical protein n=1 Tax=Roseixanthobacter liquoris TaxID=3119921 RepID=UPI0037288CD4
MSEINKIGPARASARLCARQPRVLRGIRAKVSPTQAFKETLRLRRLVVAQHGTMVMA